jgi:glutamyl endopeptidase
MFALDGCAANVQPAAMRASRGAVVTVAMVLGVGIGSTIPMGGAAGQAPPPPPPESTTVTSDGRTLTITPAGRQGTEGAFGATPGSLPPSPALTDKIGPLELASAESIIGTDNRTKVSDTTNKPARMVALLTLSGNQWCTGFLIAADTVVTSGHCIYNRSTRRFYDAASMRAYPGYDATRPNPAPYGVCGVRLLVTTSAWINSGSDEYDYGALKLTCTAGRQTGWFGWWYQTASLNGTQSRNHGYPGDRALTQWKTADSIRVSELRRLYYANDTYGGSSGSPIFTKRGSSASQCAGWCVMAVHGYGIYGATYPTSSLNHGVRVTREVSDAFFAWRTL